MKTAKNSSRYSVKLDISEMTSAGGFAWADCEIRDPDITGCGAENENEETWIVAASSGDEAIDKANAEVALAGVSGVRVASAMLVSHGRF